MGSTMANIVIILIVAAVVTGVVFYLYKAKKNGQTCIGCPYAKQCGGNCGSKEQTLEYVRAILKIIKSSEMQSQVMERYE